MKVKSCKYRVDLTSCPKLFVTAAWKTCQRTKSLLEGWRYWHAWGKTFHCVQYRRSDRRWWCGMVEKGIPALCRSRQGRRTLTKRCSSWQIWGQHLFILWCETNFKWNRVNGMQVMYHSLYWLKWGISAWYCSFGSLAYCTCRHKKRFTMPLWRSDFHFVFNLFNSM